MKLIFIIILISVYFCIEVFSNQSTAELIGYIPPNKYFEQKVKCEQLSPINLPDNFNYDMGAKVGDLYRPSVWNAKYTYLGNTCYKASIGAVYYEDEKNEDPDYFSIEVEIRQVRENSSGTLENVYRTLYRRQFSFGEISPVILTKNIDEVVTYDESKGIVKFDLTTKVYRYKLPMP